jgi:cytoskeletal protein RodZ
VTKTPVNDQPPAGPTAPVGMRRRMAWVVGAVVVALFAAAIIGTVASQSAPLDPKSSNSPTASSPTPTESATATTPSPTPTANATEQAPTPIGDPADTDIGVTVTVTSLKAVEGEGQGAGEVSGPSIQFVVSVGNGTSADVSLAGVVINVYYGDDQTPAGELTGGASSPLPGAVGAGATVAGTYVFAIPKNQRSNVRITVDYQAGSPIVVFEGPAPTK